MTLWKFKNFFQKHCEAFKTIIIETYNNIDIINSEEIFEVSWKIKNNSRKF